MANPPLIIGIGEILWDMLPAGRQLGGAPANFAYHASALGAHAAVVSRVGADGPGRDILQHLDQVRLDRAHVSTDDRRPTGVVNVSLDSSGVPSYEIKEDVAWDFLPRDSNLLAVAGKADAVCFGTLAQRSTESRESIQAFVHGAGLDCLKILDINLRQHYYSRDLIVDLLRISDVLKLNDQELPIVAKLLSLKATDAAEVASSILADFPLRLIALTRGPAGSVLYERHGQTDNHPGFPSKVADTVGAGDAFTAALVLGLLQRKSLAQINIHANRLAAYVCSQPGAMPVIPPDLRSIA